MKSDPFRTKSSFFSCQNDVLVDQNVVLVDQNVVLFHQNDVLVGLIMTMGESGLQQPGEPGRWGGLPLIVGLKHSGQAEAWPRQPAPRLF